MKNLLAALLLFISVESFAQSCDQVPYGIPTSAKTTTTLCRKAYVVKYYNKCKAPLVVVEHLKADAIGGTEPRQTFMQDPDLPDSIRAKLSDYEGRSKYGIDIGHMAPAADFKTDAEEMQESFYLSNAIPQATKNNRVIWRLLEMRVRALAVKYNDVYVFTGGIYSDKPEKIGSVCKPTTLFKVVIDTKSKESVGYLIPNTDEAASFKFDKYITTVSAVEVESKINFTPKLKLVSSKILKSSIGQSFANP